MRYLRPVCFLVACSTCVVFASIAEIARAQEKRSARADRQIRFKLLAWDVSPIVWLNIPWHCISYPGLE